MHTPIYNQLMLWYRPRTLPHIQPTTGSNSGSGRTRPILNDEQKLECLNSLGFEQIDARQSTIKSAHAKTCRWLLKSRQYLDWLDTTKLDDHYGFLWIKGKAGTGKSTLMKFASAHARKPMREQSVLSFFFNARGEDLEKSTVGTYRSLLLQLLTLLPRLQRVFEYLGLSIEKVRGNRQWTTELLKDALEQAVQELGDSRVVCFIDALDECEEDQIRDMVQFFEHIGDLAVSNGIHFQVCLSSRHYPYITIRKGVELVLEGHEGHSQDITNYVESELKIGKSKIAQQVRAELQEKASGIFMWVVLVVRFLNKASDQGKVHTLSQKLREIPGDLHELFFDMLTRDAYDKEELVLCIQWLLFAKQPLNPEQLYYAIHAARRPVDIAERDPEVITEDVIHRFILNSSKGLAEITTLKESRVQFIHESVRDFLLKEDGLGKIWPELRNNFMGQSHEQLKQCCLNYISFDSAVLLGNNEVRYPASSSEAARLRDSAAQKFPFLKYAAQNLLFHADAAEGEGISQVHFLNNFRHHQWVEFNNIFEKFQVRRHTRQVSLLYLLAEYDMANLLKITGLVERCTDEETDRYGCPLFVALAMGSHNAFRVLVDSLEVPEAQKSLAIFLKERCQHELIGNDGKQSFTYAKSRGILLNAAEFKSDALVALLIRFTRLKIDHVRLMFIPDRDYALSVEALLAVDSSALGTNAVHYRSMLRSAIFNMSTGVFEVLSEQRFFVDANVLMSALYAGRIDAIKRICEKGTNVSLDDLQEFYSRAMGIKLWRAQAVEAVAVLLEEGPNLPMTEYRAMLLQASSKGHEEIVRLILTKNIEFQAQYYQAAISEASRAGHERIVKLIHDKSVNVNVDFNAQHGQFDTAIQATVLEDQGDMLDKQREMLQGGVPLPASESSMTTTKRTLTM